MFLPDSESVIFPKSFLPRIVDVQKNARWQAVSSTLEAQLVCGDLNT